MTSTTEGDTARQQELGIIHESVDVYRYKTHVYHKLSDALKYAEIDMKRDEPDQEAPTKIVIT